MTLSFGSAYCALILIRIFSGCGLNTVVSAPLGTRETWVVTPFLRRVSAMISVTANIVWAEL